MSRENGELVQRGFDSVSRAEIEELFLVGDQLVTCLRFWGRERERGAPVEIRDG
jgi:hypothetical protein